MGKGRQARGGSGMYREGPLTAGWGWAAVARKPARSSRWKQWCQLGRIGRSCFGVFFIENIQVSKCLDWLKIHILDVFECCGRLVVLCWDRIT